MKSRLLLARLSWVLCAACAAKAAAASSTAAPREPLHRIVVGEKFTRQIDRGCVYHATVRGVLEPVLASHASPPAAAVRYRPDLRIDAELRCPAVSREQRHASVQGEPRTRAQIEQAVQLASRITVATDDIMCFYAATFRFDGRHLAGQNLARWCEMPPPARGGGPVAAEAAPRNSAGPLGP